MLLLNIFCIAFGDSAKDFSSIFELGSRGISVKTSFQYLGVSALIVGVNFLFFTDRIIKNMAIWLRTICTVGIVILIITVFIILFKWFPINMWQPWVMFILCFGFSFLGSYLVTLLKEKTENKKLEEALKRLKEKEKSEK